MEERHEIIHFSPNIPMRVFLHKLGFVDKHWHKSLELLMVLDGEVTITIDDKTFFLNTEDIILINSNSIHEIHSESAVLIALQIDLSRVNHFRSDLEDCYFDCNSTTSTDSELFQGIRFSIASILRENVKNSIDAEYKNYALTYYLVSELISYFKVATDEHLRNRRKHMLRLTRIINYVQDHYTENFTLNDLAQAEGLSAPYLSTFFEKNMGIKFSQYYTNIKLEHAVNDLVTTKDTVESIALRNGFTESHSFVRSFKKKYGVTPTIYRTEHSQYATTNYDSSNLNYLLLEPSNHLNLLTKYTNPFSSDFTHSMQSTNKVVDVPEISVNESFRKLRHTFKNFITVSRAKDLLNRDIQDMLKDIQSEIGYKYIKFHGILSDDMMVVSRTNGILKFHYTLVDMALDFLLSINLKPMIQLSFMPEELASDLNKTIFYSKFNTSPPKDMNEWEYLIKDFTKHLISRYGQQEVTSWLFTVWNEPISSKAMFGFGDDKLFYRFYKCTYNAVKKICNNIPFGSPSILYMENIGTDDWIQKFIEFTKRTNCVPDFMCFHYYADIIPKINYINYNVGLSPVSTFPRNTDDFSLWVGSIKKIMAELELQKLPIYLTEWNFTFSHRNLINDTCFKSCYIMKNLLQNYDRLESFGYWSLTDMTEENSLPDMLFHGGLGIYTMNGIRKNVFYAFHFANMLGDTHITSGDGYFMTRQNDSIQIITYHYVHYGNLFASGELFDITETNRYTTFDMSRNLEFHFNLKDLENGKYQIKEFFVNRDYGSAFDIWLQYGGIPIDKHDAFFMRHFCVPMGHKDLKLVENGTLSYNPVLKPLEIRFTEIRPLK